MRHAGRLWAGGIGIAALTLALLLGGCGVTSGTGSGRTATATPAPTATIAAPATVSPEELETDGCPNLGTSGFQVISAGPLKVSIPSRILDYPSALLPTNAPKAPYQLAASAVQNFDPNPPVNPTMSPGYGFQVCNTTPTAHTLTSITVTIVRFTPSSGPVNIWHLCDDGPYDTATKRPGSGCGGAFGGVGLMAANLPSDSTGASAVATANTAFQDGGMNLPATLGPNKSIEIAVAVNGLTSQGTYDLRFDLSVDGAAPSPLALAGGPFLIAPAATLWTGGACLAPAMQAQIPASSHDAYYVCPPAS